MNIPLCYRCEHRARFLTEKSQGIENPHRPRFECGNDSAVVSCYMFCPIKPVVLENYPGDKRPRFSISFISAREQAVGLADDFELNIKRVKKNKMVLYWEPKNEK